MLKLYQAEFLGIFLNYLKVLADDVIKSADDLIKNSNWPGKQGD